LSFVTDLRFLVLARRAAIALEDIADSQRTLASLAQDAWNESHAPRKPRVAEFGTLDQDAVNKRYHKEREAQMFEPIPEDEI
jgi:hypothetical protein